VFLVNNIFNKKLQIVINSLHLRHEK